MCLVVAADDDDDNSPAGVLLVICGAHTTRPHKYMAKNKPSVYMLKSMELKTNENCSSPFSSKHTDTDSVDSWYTDTTKSKREKKNSKRYQSGNEIVKCAGRKENTHTHTQTHTKWDAFGLACRGSAYNNATQNRCAT